MSRVCQLTGKRANNGMDVSHSHVSTKKLQQVNLQERRLWWAEGNRFVKLRLSTRALKTIQKKGLGAYAKELGIKKIRVNQSGCLERCELGAALVIYPEGIWYTYSTKEDVDEILDRHIMKGELVERLILDKAQLQLAKDNGLRVDELAEGEGRVGDRPIDRVVRGQLEEPADRGAALVELTGRVEEAGAVAEGRGAAGGVAEEAPDPERGRVDRGGGGDERLEREVALRAAPGEVGGERPDERDGPLGAAQGCVREEREPLAADERDGRRGRDSRLLGGEDGPGQLLRLLDVRLVERVDPEHGSGDRGRHFPADELAAEVHRIGEAVVVHVDFAHGDTLEQRGQVVRRLQHAGMLDARDHDVRFGAVQSAKARQSTG